MFGIVLSMWSQVPSLTLACGYVRINIDKVITVYAKASETSFAITLKLFIAQP